MAVARSLTCSNLGSLHLRPRQTSHSRIRLPLRLLGAPTSNYACFSSENRGIGKSTGLFRRVQYNLSAKMDGDVQVEEEAAKSPKQTFLNWIALVLLAMLSVVLPGWKEKLKMMLKLEDEAEKAVEKTAEAVVSIADATEKVIEEMEGDLPADGKLRKGLLTIENAVEAAEKDAKVAEDVIHKIHELKEEVETIVEPVLDQVEVVKEEA